MYIAIDFDGTIVEDKWPEIGNILPHAKSVIKQFKADGHKIILNTCREGKLLKEAFDFLKENGIEPDFVNDNPVARSQYGNCKKTYGDIYIDDHNAFIPKTEHGIDWLWIKKRYMHGGDFNVVTRPSHYQGKYGLQALEVIEAFDLDYKLGNAIKYITRAGKKDSNSKSQDIKKAIFYLSSELEDLEDFE